MVTVMENSYTELCHKKEEQQKLQAQKSSKLVLYFLFINITRFLYEVFIVCRYSSRLQKSYLDIQILTFLHSPPMAPSRTDIKVYDLWRLLVVI